MPRQAVARGGLLTFERVYTVTDYWDGPREGIADFRGVPHLYRSIFLKEEDDWDPDRFLLSPVSPEILALALESWAIWRRWESAYREGRTALATHPALPDDRARHAALDTHLAPLLRIDPARVLVARGDFRPVSPNAHLHPGVMQALEVRWTPLEDQPPAA
jgi:hypothetical protein